MAYAGKLTYKTELDTSGVQKSGNTIKSIIAGLGITKVISMAMNEISNSVDDAISRFDTLNNFPKVMSNLGIASEDADKSIKKMSDKLAGLPTTLDQGASAVQRFTSANSDVEKSTDIFLALNNAILAGGAGSEIQASALEQLSQAYAKGKPDMMEWRTAMTAMPAQLKQVATAMGYVSADALGEALREGTVSMDDFMDTITKLNTEGVDGFQSFEQQARNSTGGIGTAITVAKTQIVKGVTDLITAINNGLAQANLPSISEIIASIGRKAKEALDVIASKLPSVINFMVKMYQTIKPFIPVIEALGAGILAVVTAFTIYQKVMTIVTAVQTAFNIVMAMNPITLIILAIIALIAIIAVLWVKCETFRNIVLGIFNALKTAFNVVVEVIKFGVNLVISYIQLWFTIWKTIFEAIRAVVEFVINAIISYIKFWITVWTTVINTIINLVKGFINFVKSVPNTIISFFTSLPNRMKDIGLNIVRGIGNGITSGVSWIKARIQEFVGNVTKFIKKLFKIGSPSKLMGDEVGQWLPKGIAVAITANTDSVTDAMDGMYDEINREIKMQNSKLNLNAISGDVYNKTLLQTPVSISIDADVEMDSTKVGRLVTPVVSKTIKTGGGI